MKPFCLFFSLSLVFSARAQDTHYWNSQYGPGGFFLPGAVIAFNGDSGVYFYNPALFARSKKSSISLNAVLYQTQGIQIKNGAGTGKNLESRNNSSVPQMLAGSIALGKKKFTLAYALIHTPGIGFTASQRRDEKFQVLSDDYSPGTEYFVGQYVIENRASETRAQIGTGFSLGPKWSAGLTLEGNLHNQYYSLNYLARALVNPGVVNFPLVSSDADYLADYTGYGMRVRGGLAYDGGTNHIGVTVNTPLIRLGGTGTIVSDNVINSLLLPGFTDPISIIANTRQEDLKVYWKTPLSIAAGYLHDFPKGQLYISAEYFAAIKEYDILSPKNSFFIRPDTGNNNLFTYSLLRLKDNRKQVINFSIGHNFSLRKNITAFSSFRTDLSFLDRNGFKDNTGIVPFTAYWDNYHLQLGINKRARNRNMRAGLFFIYGSTDKYEQVINFDDPNEPNVLQGNTHLVSASALTVGLILSYIQNF